MFDVNDEINRNQIVETIHSYTKKFDCCRDIRTVVMGEGSELHGFNAVTFNNGDEVMFMFDFTTRGSVHVETKHLRSSG